MTTVQILWGNTPADTVPSVWQDVCGVWQGGAHQEDLLQQKKQGDKEQEMSQEYSEGKIETVSINSIHKNKKQSMLTAKLEMHTGNNKLTVPYKIDTGSDDSIMPWYAFKKLFPRVTEAELKKNIKKHIKLKTYNKTVITQLGTCVVIIDYKDNKKKHEFFVVPGSGQALLGMPDTAALKIINVNIYSIEAARTWKEDCNTNMANANESDNRQEAHVVKESCTNIDEDLVLDNNVNRSSNNTSINTLTNYFLSSPNMEVDKRKSIELSQIIHNVFHNVFNGIGCFGGTFSLQLKPGSKPYQVPPRHVAYILQKPFKDELDQLKN